MSSESKNVKVEESKMETEEKIEEFDALDSHEASESSETDKDVKKVKKRTKRDIQREIHGVITQIQWITSMYYKLGDKNVQQVKDESSGEVLTLPSLNRKLRELTQDLEKTVVYMVQDEQGKTRPRRKYNGQARNNFSIPVLIDEKLYGFFREAELGSLDGVPVRDLVPGLAADAKPERRVLNANILQDLFMLWILHNQVKRPDGTVLYKTLRSPREKCKVYPDAVFLKYFGEDLPRVAKTARRPPLANVSIREGEEVISVPYVIFTPDTLACLSGREHRTSIKDEEETYKEELREVREKLGHVKTARVSEIDA